MSYNPAKDEAKLRSIVDGTSEKDGSPIFPARWVRCLAAEILELRQRLAEAEREIQIVRDRANLENTAWKIATERLGGFDDYLEHKKNCRVFHHWHNECDCGLSQVRTELRQLATDEPTATDNASVIPTPQECPICGVTDIIFRGRCTMCATL